MTEPTKDGGVVPGNKPVVDPEPKLTLDEFKALQEERDRLKAHADKLLSEKKAAADKVKEFEAKEKELEEQRLKEKEDWKKIAANREEELNSFKGELDGYKKQELNRRKYSAFIDSCPVESKFLGLVDIDQIVIDPTTNEIDSMSVTKLVESFKKSYPETLGINQANKIPNKAPGDGSGDMSVEEWQKLPLADKKKHMKQVYERETQPS